MLLFSSCSKKTLSFKDAEVADEFALNTVDFEYLSTSSKIRFSDQGSNLNATANIRLKKDSIIWVSVTPGFGIEAARGIITQDSLIFLNRLDKEYSAYNFKELSEKFNFNINFELLQSILLGNMPVAPEEDDLIRKESNYFVVQQEMEDISIRNYVGVRSLKLERVSILDRSPEEVMGKTRLRNNTLLLNYDDFQMLEDQIFPFENMVSLAYQRNGQKQKTEINIEHKKASITDEALRFPFSVPDKYVRK
ncbi:MAG: DUF4292 domain-containing protein [Cyclobacteriaceae bacterium]